MTFPWQGLEAKLATRLLTELTGSWREGISNEEKREAVDAAVTAALRELGARQVVEGLHPMPRITEVPGVEVLPTGLALYVRSISPSHHGTPAEFASQMKGAGLRWIALGGPWHELRDGKVRTGMINSEAEIHDYGDALEAAGIEVYVWGYPWLGTEELFVERIVGAAKWGRVLLDPELGANPSRKVSGPQKAKANAAARDLVSLLAGTDQVSVCGLSTFGAGYRIGWFPLVAYARALHDHFPGRAFIGGQTYTVGNDLVDRSKEDMLGLIHRDKLNLELVPNFGVYDRVEGKVIKRSAKSLLNHLQHFIDDPIKPRALIGWAENFLTPETAKAMARFDDAMEWPG